MKVLVCAFACVKDPDGRFGQGKGGEVSLGWNLVKQIARFNRAWVLTDADNRADIEEAVAQEKILGITFCYIDLPSFKFLKLLPGGIQMYSYVWQIRAYGIAKKLHQNIHFDLFHHVTYANDWMASYIGALLPIPYIRGPGGGAHKVPKKFLEEYPFKDRVKEKARDFGQWVFKQDPFFIMGQRKAKAILVCNHEAFDAMPASWQKKTQFFPVNGVSKNDIKAVIPKNTTGVFSIITAGKLLRLKSFDVAIRAFAIFSQKIENAQFTIVGDGPELSNLTALVKKLHLEGRVVFTSWMSHPALLDAIGSSDVFLFPSLRDGGGAVVVEAMATATPVVCFDIAGPGFHVDNTCGIKVLPSSPRQAVDDIATALKLLYDNKDLRMRLGQGAKEKAEKKYDWDVLGDRLNEMYKKI
jgi:glycosyltransferase involved in cell wall biosynthesis